MSRLQHNGFNIRRQKVHFMNKLFVFVSIVILAGGISFWVYKGQQLPSLAQEPNLHKHDENETYTCPMHPQIKQDHPGKCPICHMDLVKVKKKNQGHDHANMGSSGERGEIQASDLELKLIGVQKHRVQKMNLDSEVAVSGRFTSSSSIAFQVYERDLSVIKVGNIVRGSAAIAPDIKLVGKITTIDSYVDPTSRTIRVLANLERPFQMARNESSFHGKVEVHVPNVLAIPEDAILHTGEKDLVYLFQDDQTLKPHTAKLGMKVNGYYQVLEGLKIDDEITTGANFLLDSEAKIRGTK